VHVQRIFRGLGVIRLVLVADSECAKQQLLC